MDRPDQPSAPAVDDCWNRIGVFGDRSCEWVPRHIHCHNCERYAEAATLLLDRYALERGASFEELEAEDDEALEGLSALVFRLGDQWLAWPSRQLVEIAPLGAIHSLPHQRSTTLLGVSNVRGTLVACLSLATLLGLEPGSRETHEGRMVPRMLVLAAPDGPLVVPADEVSGIDRLPISLIREASRDGSQAAGRYAAGVLKWRGRSVTLLDETRVLEALGSVLG